MNYVINGSGKFIALILFLLSSLALVSCSSTTGSENVGPPFVMSISPGNQTVTAGTTIQFVVTISGTDQSVTWTATAGIIDEFGVYTAPGNVTVATTVTITATSVANTARSISTTLTVIPFPTYSKFSSAGNMLGTGSVAVARYGHTATRLSSGIVLVAGGVGSTGDTSITNAEIYIPTATPSTYIATGAMTIARAFHTATFLKNGLVLITGGISARTATTALDSAELYNPANGTFIATGTMGTPRAHHTATLLNNGKVLVAGGISTAAGPAVKAAELYDPATGTFSYTNNTMHVKRAYHTATLLNNGKVMIAGGTDGTATLASVEYLLPPEVAPFGDFSSSTAIMSSPRERHAATKLRSGSVLITGGSPNKTFDLFSSGNLLIPFGSMSTARYDHTSTLLPNGKVLVTGGSNGTTHYLKSAELYSTGAFSLFVNMSTARANHAATLLYNGRVLITGGQNASGPVTTYELFR